MKLFGKELTLEQTIGFVRCQSPELTGDCKDCLMVQAAMDLISEVERLKSENATLKKALISVTGIKNDYFKQLQGYIKAFRLHQSALELAVPSENDRECYLKQAQKMEAEK